MGRGKLNWKCFAGWCVAAGALVWVSHDVDFAAMIVGVAGVEATWLCAAVACDVLSYICQAERWRLLLRPLGHLSRYTAVRAIYAGLFTNEVLPLRFGEAVRALLVARTLREGISQVIPSIAVERLIDALWLAAGVGGMALWIPLPAGLTRAAELFGGAIAALTAAFVLLVFRPPAFLSRWSSLPGSRLRSFAGRVFLGVSRVRLDRGFVAAALWSLLLLLLQACAFWFVMVACKLPLGYLAAFAIFLIVHLGTAIPNAPANVGAFQFFAVVGLQAFGIDKTAAAGFSMVVFVVLTVPLWILGFAAVTSFGVTLRQLPHTPSDALSDRRCTCSGTRSETSLSDRTWLRAE